MPRITQRPRLCALEEFSADWHPLVREIYASRLRSAQEVEKRLQALLPPDGIPDIDKAAARIFHAIHAQESILVYGDYDVDGASSTALLVRVLRKLGATVRYFVPNRQVHGYGLSVAGLAEISTIPPLVITVDNGITAFSAAEYLRAQGIDLIITDHHEPEATLPVAVAVVNPKRHDSGFASLNLAGVGVVFYLLLALRRYYRTQAQPFECDLSDYLDLVALGTVADIVPLDYNNRILVQAGIRRLQSGQGNIGLRALCDVANLETACVLSSDIGFSLAPRLNAVGRLEDMHDGVHLLLAEDWATAEDYAQLLDTLNRDRKAIESEMTALAEPLVNPKEPIASAYLPEGHEGVIGIVAARLKSKFARPALVATTTADGNSIKASLRSVSGVNIHQLLSETATQLPDNALQFGGHAMAAGLSIDKAHYADFITALNTTFTATIGAKIPEEPLYIDGELPADLLTLDWARYLEKLEPWGAALPVPQFCNIFIVAECRRLGAQHTRLTLRHPHTGEQFSATWFFKNVDWQYGNTVRVVYQIQVNRFAGNERLNLLITYAEHT